MQRHSGKSGAQQFDYKFEGHAPEKSAGTARPLYKNCFKLLECKKHRLQLIEAILEEKEKEETEEKEKQKKVIKKERQIKQGDMLMVPSI